MSSPAVKSKLKTGLLGVSPSPPINQAPSSFSSNGGGLLGDSPIVSQTGTAVPQVSSPPTIMNGPGLQPQVQMVYNQIPNIGVINNSGTMQHAPAMIGLNSDTPVVPLTNYTSIITNPITQGPGLVSGPIMPSMVPMPQNMYMPPNMTSQASPMIANNMPVVPITTTDCMAPLISRPPGLPNNISSHLVGSPSTGILASKQSRITSDTYMPTSSSSSGSGLLGDHPEINQSSRQRLPVKTHLPDINKTKRSRERDLPKSIFIQNDPDKFRKSLSKKFLDIYNNQSKTDSTFLTFLADRIIYKNSSNTLSQLRVNLDILMLNSNRISAAVEKWKRAVRDGLKNEGPSQAAFTQTAKNCFQNGLILGLPAQLKQKVIENVIGYIHGNHIQLCLEVSEKSTLDPHGTKPKTSIQNFLNLFIVARYLKCEELCEKLVKLKEEQKDLKSRNIDFEGLGRFSDSLPEIEFFGEMPGDVDVLPSLDEVIDLTE